MKEGATSPTTAETTAETSQSTTEETPSTAWRRRWAAGIIFLAVGIAVWILAREHLSLEFLVEREIQLRSTIERRPWAAFGIGFCVYTLVSMFPGTSGKSIICGWLFGFWAALTMVITALTLAAIGGFTISRYLLRDVVQQRFAHRLGEVDGALARDGMFYLLTVRMLHIPFTLVNYLCGASSVDIRTFIWTTAVGLIPSTAIFVGVGSGLPTLRDLLDNGASGLINPTLMAGLVLMGLAPWVLRWLARRVGTSATPSDSKSDSPTKSSATKSSATNVAPRNP